MEPITPDFDEATHTYSIAGLRKDSVTQCLAEYLKIDVSGSVYYVHVESGAVIPKHIFEAAGDFGTAIHAAAGLLLQGGLDMGALAGEILPSVVSLQYWLEQNVEMVFFAEQPLYSKRYDYCGMPDIYCRLKQFRKGRDLLDIKTGLFNMADPQTAAYEQLIRENHAGSRTIEIRRWVLHVPKDGSDCELIRMSRKDALWYFLNALQMKRWRDKK